MVNFESTLAGSRSPQKGRKYFTLAEARRALPLIQRIARDIQTSHAERVRIGSELASDVVRFSKNAETRLQQEFDHQSERISSLLDELDQVGVELKDPTRGLLDFPSVHQNREIYLCYQMGEPTIVSWHELDTGYAGRRPVDELQDS